jgi:hypothetical protein
MTMHLEGPWLTTTGKKRGKKKWPSAEAKAKAQHLDEQWKALQKKWASEIDEKRRKRALSAPVMTFKSGPKVPPGRETPHINSVDTGMIPCVKVRDQEYTGTKVKGIGTMHKSNAVPIFSDEEAVDISKMRR